MSIDSSRIEIISFTIIFIRNQKLDLTLYSRLPIQKIKCDLFFIYIIYPEIKYLLYIELEQAQPVWGGTS